MIKLKGLQCHDMIATVNCQRLYLYQQLQVARLHPLKQTIHS